MNRLVPPPQPTPAELIAALKMKPTRIAVELNREVVPKADYASITLREGDELELINFVGGG